MLGRVLCNLPGSSVAPGSATRKQRAAWLRKKTSGEGSKFVQLILNWQRRASSVATMSTNYGLLTVGDDKQGEWGFSLFGGGGCCLARFQCFVFLTLLPYGGQNV